MSKEGWYLSVDLGSSNCKVMLCNIQEGDKFSIKEVGRFTTPRILVREHVCINIYQIYGEICSILRRIGNGGVLLKSLGVDSWASDFGIINSENELAALPVFYRDKRTDGIMDEVEKVIDYRLLYSMTTQRKMQDSTLCQMLAIQKEQPGLLSEGNRFLHIGDLLMFFFSGKIASEISIASYSQMFNMRKKNWENRVFELFNIPKTLQPEIVSAGTVLGQISEKQAAWYGTNVFDITTPAVHDTASAGAIIPGEKNEKWAYISTGSWYLVAMNISEVANKELSYQYQLSNTGAAFSKILLKQNICAMWLLQQCKNSWENKGIALSYGEILASAQRAHPFYAFIDPDDSCFYNPDDMAETISDYLSRKKQLYVEAGNVGQIARIIYESVSFKCRYALSVLEKVAGERIDIVYVVGGTSGESFLNRMLASATGKVIIKGPSEAAAIGNALLQAYGNEGEAGEEKIRRIIKNSFFLEKFYPVHEKEWEKHYLEYLGFCGLTEV